ncbi:transcriptional regulator [Listeria monocytogenes]|nr:transcriptional regulator [Listeria monocytogenes]
MDKTVRASTTLIAEAAFVLPSFPQQVPPSPPVPHFSQSPSQNVTSNNHPGANNSKTPPSQASHPPNSAQMDAATFLAINPLLLLENREQTLKLLLLNNKKSAHCPLA